MLHGWTTGLSAAAAVGLAAGGCAYAAMWPTSQIFGRTLIAPQRPDEIALTFDDGPNPAWTPRLLDVLAQHGVKATFFLVGRYVEAEPLLVRRLAEAGHVLGNHTWSHPNLAVTAPGKVWEELRRTQDTVQQTTGERVRWFRPPFGARRPDVLRAARALGMTPVLWNVMTSDWKEPSGERIAEALSAKVASAGRSGRAANVVLHDGGHLVLGTDRGPSVRAAELLLNRFAGERRFVTVESWV